MSTLNLSGAYPVRPFTSANELSPKVTSDHAAIRVRTPEGFVIGSHNISNPAWHTYFKYNPVFAQTHLYVDQPIDAAGIPIESMQRKIDSQIETIARQFKEKVVDIQVIQEGYHDFYEQLARKMHEMGINDFHIVRAANYNRDLEERYNDRTGILISGRFKILEEGIKNIEYQEEAVSSDAPGWEKNKKIHFVHVHVCDTVSKRETIIGGIHLRGCPNDRPRTGAMVLAQEIEMLWNKTKRADVVVMGDFNTPSSIVEYAAKTIKSVRLKVLVPSYLTTVNNNQEGICHDQALVACVDERTYDVLPANELSESCQALIASIRRNLII